MAGLAKTLTFAAALALGALFTGCSTPKPAPISENEAAGRLLLSQLRTLRVHPARPGQPEEVAALLDKLSDRQPPLNYGEKWEIAVLSLAFLDLDESDFAALKYLLGPDAARLGADLEKVSDRVLREQFGLNKSRIKEYREHVRTLKKARRLRGNQPRLA
ncbi:MAG: hypothetical protein JO317_06935 [Verrucomicrobiae bacterium]|nr:hypothetical protein [Verrucomicrobiae bacterium]